MTCTVLLLSFRIDFADGRLVHFSFLFAEAPVLMGLVAAAAAAAWIAYFSLGGRRR